MRFSTMMMAAAATVALSGTAMAAPSLTFGNLGEIAASETLFADYDTATPTPSAGSVGVTSVGIPNVAASVGTGNFGYVTGGTSVSYDFGFAHSSFSLDVGSPDSYNYVTLSLANGTTSTFTSFGGQAARYTFTADNSLDAITGVQLGSNANSFEFDNLSIGSAVPETATWAMMILGVGAVGGMMRRAHRKSEADFTRKVRGIANA